MHYERNKKYGDPLFKKESHKDYLEKYAISFSGDECLIWPFKVSASNGYGFISHEGKQCGAHRYICQLAHGKPPSDSHEAAHDCGIRACVNHRHLRWATVKENMADKLKHGTDQRGEKQGSSKLTNEKVLIIRRLIKTHHPVAIAKMFGVSREAINSIRFSRTWRWLEQPKDSDL